jgi:hypothetical protein
MNNNKGLQEQANYVNKYGTGVEVVYKDQQLISDRSRSSPDYLQKVISVLPTNSIDSLKANELYSKSKKNKNYDHEFVLVTDEVIDPSLWLITKTDFTYLSDSAFPLLFFWNNPLFPMFTLTLFWKLKENEELGENEVVQYRAFFPHDSYEWDLFHKRKAKVIVLRKGRCIFALEIDMPKIDPQFWSLIDLAPPVESVRDLNAAKAWVEGKIVHKRTQDKELEFSWAKRLATEVLTGMRFLGDPNHAEQVETEKKIMLNSPFAESLEDKHGIAAHFYQYYVNEFNRSDREGYENLVGYSAFIHENLKEAPIHSDFIKLMMECAWFSSLGTNCGHEIRSLTLEGNIESVPLDVGRLGKCVDHFWDRLPFELPYYYKELCGASACPIDMHDFVKKAPLYQGDLEKGAEFVNNLLAEATSLKQWTIPSGAYVQVELGSIKAVKMFELNNEVACILVDESGHYLIAWVDPSKQLMRISGEFALVNAAGIEEGKAVANSNDRKQVWERIVMGIRVLLACIIRDFWIVEERERVFGPSYMTRKTPRLKSEWGDKVIVYIPRIHYVGDIKNNAEALNLVSRRAHFVIGHLRKALHASEDQIILARKYGIVVPEGFTFVRPHRRGDQAQEHIYRSRSALNCIRALTKLSEGSVKDDWFTYELNVKQWLASNGYEVVHLAGNRNGDGGVDIQAMREDEHLLVQCKYRLKAKIGPDVIRELLGTLQTFPAGANGLVVTSSELTDGAKELAIKHNVQFIERADFLTGLKGKL